MTDESNKTNPSLENILFVGGPFSDVSQKIKDHFNWFENTYQNEKATVLYFSKAAELITGIQDLTENQKIAGIISEINYDAPSILATYDLGDEVDYGTDDHEGVMLFVKLKELDAFKLLISEYAEPNDLNEDINKGVDSKQKQVSIINSDEINTIEKLFNTYHCIQSKVQEEQQVESEPIKEITILEGEPIEESTTGKQVEPEEPSKLKIEPEEIKIAQDPIIEVPKEELGEISKPYEQMNAEEVDSIGKALIADPNFGVPGEEKVICLGPQQITVDEPVAEESAQIESIEQKPIVQKVETNKPILEEKPTKELNENIEEIKLTENNEDKKNDLEDQQVGGVKMENGDDSKSFIDNHKSKLIGGVVAAAFAGLIGGGVLWYDNTVKDNKEDHLQKIESILTQSVNANQISETQSGFIKSKFDDVARSDAGSIKKLNAKREQVKESIKEYTQLNATFKTLANEADVVASPDELNTIQLGSVNTYLETRRFCNPLKITNGACTESLDDIATLNVKEINKKNTDLSNQITNAMKKMNPKEIASAKPMLEGLTATLQEVNSSYAAFEYMLEEGKTAEEMSANIITAYKTVFELAVDADKLLGEEETNLSQNYDKLTKDHKKLGEDYRTIQTELDDIRKAQADDNNNSWKQMYNLEQQRANGLATEKATLQANYDTLKAEKKSLETQAKKCTRKRTRKTKKKETEPVVEKIYVPQRSNF